MLDLAVDLGLGLGLSPNSLCWDWGVVDGGVSHVWLSDSNKVSNKPKIFVSSFGVRLIVVDHVFNRLHV